MLSKPELRTKSSRAARPLVSDTIAGIPDLYSYFFAVLILDEVMLEESIRKFSMAFEEQFHYGCFYAYLKIKEQEIKNITWLADLITMQADRNLPGWNKVIVPFMYHVNDERDINQ